jgi:poly-gamma-glutamate capsule biosynthesis protein CapA/YwtB (metallophosphatase superfamily)
MKYLLLSIITILAVELSTPTKEIEYDTSVDSLLARTNNTFKKASTVCVKAEKQQAKIITEVKEKVVTLEKEKEELQVTLTETKSELQNVKETINTNAADTGEQFDLFPSN